MWDPACNRGPASIGTSELDPRPVCGARRLFGAGARLLSEAPAPKAEMSIYQFLLFDLSASWSVGELSSYLTLCAIVDVAPAAANTTDLKINL